MAKRKYKIYDPNTIKVVKKSDGTTSVHKVQKPESNLKTNTQKTTNREIVKHTFGGGTDAQKARREQTIRSQSLALIRKKYKMVSDQDLKLESRLLIFNRRLREFPVKNIVTIIKALLKNK